MLRRITNWVLRRLHIRPSSPPPEPEVRQMREQYKRFLAVEKDARSSLRKLRKKIRTKPGRVQALLMEEVEELQQTLDTLRREAPSYRNLHFRNHLPALIDEVGELLAKMHLMKCRLNRRENGGSLLFKMDVYGHEVF